MSIAKVSGSMSIFGVASLFFMSAFVVSRVLDTARSLRRSPSWSARPASSAAGETNETDRSGAAGAARVGRSRVGCGVVMDAFGSPSEPQTTAPPLTTISGRTAKKRGSHNTRSAILPTSIEPR